MENKLIKKILKFYQIFDRYNNYVFYKKISKLPNLNYISLLDIGSSYDIEPRWKKIKRKLNYFGLEPNEELASNLTKQNKDCYKYNIISKLISNKKELTNFYICRDPGVSSILKPNLNFLSNFQNSKRFNVEKEVELEADTLDNLISEEIDFIKIDIQGAEMKALEGAKKVLEKTIGLEVEVEFQQMYINQPLFGEINKFLIQKDFEFIDFTLIKRWERNQNSSYGQSIFANVLFLRTPEQISKNYDKDKFIRYLLILLLYNKFDLFKSCDLKKIFSTSEIREIEKIYNFFKNKNKLARFFNSISTGLSKLLGNEYKSHLFH